MSNALATLTIIAVLEIVDTRDGELVVGKGGRERWVPIPGSGNAAECARCGRDHEVHATVELSDGTTRVMGTGCAKKDAAAYQKSRISSGERRAKAIAATRGTLARLRERLTEIKARNDAAEAEVRALDWPEAVEVDCPYGTEEHGRTWWRIGDGIACAAFPGDEEHIRNFVQTRWHNAELLRRGYAHPDKTEQAIRDAERKLAKLS